ncbi:hypothetical protein CDD81_3033 [Ophiocordyceps australis]|uniref:Uncharacterized protein n=1 Tax=Ophiocordyceps australis TaxID=1399860 RepID=A0A2C5YJT1_9HYPO|nr:hypothetical protein CDD81_3033 [Ophiocordyceps australis]
MKSLLALIALPSAAVAFSIKALPASLAAQLQDASSDCILPGQYAIHDFVAKSNDTGTTLSEFEFKFIDAETGSSTKCHWNTNTSSTTPPGMTPRYSCQDRNIKFIYDAPSKKLVMIERVCPNQQGTPSFEATGSVVVPLACHEELGTCISGEKELKSAFTSLSPSRDPTFMRRSNTL